jgi:hypothetical protein
VSCFIRQIYSSNISATIEDLSMPTPSSYFSLSSSYTPTQTISRCLQPCYSSQTEAKANLGSLNISTDGTKLCEPTSLRFPRRLDHSLCASLHRSRQINEQSSRLTPRQTLACATYLSIRSSFRFGQSSMLGTPWNSEFQWLWRSSRRPAVFLCFTLLEDESGGCGNASGRG